MGPPSAFSESLRTTGANGVPSSSGSVTLGALVTIRTVRASGVSIPLISANCPRR